MGCSSKMERHKVQRTEQGESCTVSTLINTALLNRDEITLNGTLIPLPCKSFGIKSTSHIPTYSSSQ